MKKTSRASLVLLLMSLWSLCLRAGEFRGHVKLQTLTAESSPHTGFAGGSTAFFQINRLSYLNDFSNDWSVEASYELIPIWLTKASSFEVSERSYRAGDLQEFPLRQRGSFSLDQNLDRLYLTWRHGDGGGALSVGRQQVSFGSARSVNPIDVFTPFSFTAIDTEIRQGVDAVTYRHNLGATGEFKAGVLFGKDFKTENSAAYLSARFVSGELEIQPIVAGFQQATLIGEDALMTVAGANLWLESAYVHSPDSGGNYWRGVFGGEYQLTEDLSFFSEYYFNGAGSERAEKFPLLAQQFAYDRGGVFLLGRRYLNGGGTWQVTPLHTLQWILRLNLDDRTSFWTVSWDWNFEEDWYFQAGVLAGIGPKPAFLSLPRSDFGSQPTVLFTRLRYYF